MFKLRVYQVIYSHRLSHNTGFLAHYGAVMVKFANTVCIKEQFLSSA